MPVKIYLSTKYKTTAEREIFEDISQKLNGKYQSKDEYIILIGNLFCNGKDIDALIFKRDAIIILEFKNYGGEITFSENGEWFADEVSVKGGSQMNPFQQVRENKFDLMKFLNPKNIGKAVDLGHISGVVMFHKKIKFDKQQLPVGIIPWFHIIDIDNFLRKIDQITSPKIQFSQNEFYQIAKKLNIESTLKQDLEKETENEITLNNTELNDIKSKKLLESKTFAQYRRHSMLFLIETSINLHLEGFQAIKNGIQYLINTLKCSPYCVDDMQIACITYGSEILQHNFRPLSDDTNMYLLRCNDNNEVRFGEGIKKSLEMIDEQLDYAYNNNISLDVPTLIVMITSNPTDTYKKELAKILTKVESGILNVGFIYYSNDIKFYEELLDSKIMPVTFDNNNANTITSFFWIPLNKEKLRQYIENK